jgi:hypothetical protein
VTSRRPTPSRRYADRTYRYSVSPQRVRRGLGILRLEIEVEVLARVHERDRGVPFVHPTFVV